MARRTPKQKKSTFYKLLVFVVIFVAAGLFFIMQGQEETEETVWQNGSFLRIGDTQVDVREGMIYLDAVRADYEQYYGSDIWKYAIDSEGNTVGTILKEQVLEQMIYIKVVCQKADELGIVLSAEELQEVDKQTAEYMQQLEGSPLLRYGVNADIVRRIYSDNLLARKTFEVSTLNVDTNIPDKDARQHRFYSIAIRNYKIDASGQRVAYEGEEVTELQARMSELHLQAQKIDNFYKLAASITEDDSMLEILGGTGDFAEEYEAELLALATGELSEVIETTDYFYIFYCVNDYDVDATLAKKEDMISERQEAEFMRLYEDWRAASHVEVNETEWAGMDFISGN